MARRVRKAARVGAFVALALVLTGCIKLNMDLVINSDDTVSGVVQFGVQKELLELTGQSAEDLLGDAPLPSDAPGVTTEPFEDEEFAGQQFNFESVPIAQFNQTQISGPTGLTGVPATDTLSITRQGDTFVVVGELDLSGGDVTGATNPFGGTGAELLESADIRISITFPGDVVEATGGQIDGNTVTYRPEFGDVLEIDATGSAIDDGDAEAAAGGDDGGSNLLLIIILLALVAIVAIVVFLVLRNRRGGGGETGFGEAPPAATPETATPPPGRADRHAAAGPGAADAAGRPAAATRRRLTLGGAPGVSGRLGPGTSTPVKVSVGTSGWQYRHWRGTFHPAGLPSASWLGHYAERFRTVEVNASFYRLPERATVERWAASVPPSFVFVFKASRYLTHIRRLRDPEEPLRRMYDVIEGAGPKLGPVLFQLPPTLKRDDGLLEAFLERLPREQRSAFEFRHASWFADEVLEALDASGAALVHADRPGVRVAVPTVGGWSYLRFHQGSRARPGYRRAKLRAYAEAIAGVGERDVFAFFNNDAEGAAPTDATTLIELVKRRARVAA